MYVMMREHENTSLPLYFPEIFYLNRGALSNLFFVYFLEKDRQRKEFARMIAT